MIRIITYFTWIVLGLFAFSLNAQVERTIVSGIPNGAFKLKGVIGHPQVGKPGNAPVGLMVASLPEEQIKNECSFFGGDSLNGFDFANASKQVELDGGKLYLEYRAMMFRHQAAYVKKKFKLTSLPYEIAQENAKYVPETILASNCANLDFESGNFSLWTMNSGTNQNSNAQLTVLGAAFNSTNQDIYSCNDIQLITSAYGNDPIGFPGLCPTGGSFSARVGGFNINTATGYGFGCDPWKWSSLYSNGEDLEQSFVVNAGNCLVSFDFAVVLNDGGHPNGQQPYFNVYITNSANVVLNPTCTKYYVQAAAGGPPAGFVNSGYVNTFDNSIFYYQNWKSSSINLTPYIGTTVKLKFIAAGCTNGAHPAWAYIDATCGPAQLIVGNVNPCTGTTTTITAPSVFGGTYSWSGPGIVGSTTGQSITVNASGNYQVVVTPSQGAACAYTLSQVVTFITSPTLAPTAAPASLCSGNSTTLNANATNATSYNWSPGGSTASSVVVTPPVGTTTYTITVTNGGFCPKTATVPVTVTATPTVNISGNLNICSGQSTTLTGATASSYSWSVGSTSASISVSPSSTTTYTLTGTNGACSTQAVATVNVTPTPTLTISGTTAICSGQSTVLTGGTAGAYSWNPGGATTNTISVSPPTGTTTYTLTGSNGVCVSTKTVAVTVTATPTLTISGTTAICSGQSTVLTGATAGAYSWSTGATTNTISVTPPTGTTNYTLTGSNGVCVSTKTVAVTVTATPTLTISGTTTLCSGQSTILTGGTAGAYSWNPGGATTNTISVSPPTGTTNYTLTGSNGVCVSTRTVAVTVTATPTVNISGTLALCSGQSTVLTGATAGAYSWSTGATTNTISVTPPIGSTTYTLTGSNGVCTASTTATVNVTTTPTVSISGAAPICSGQSVVLTGATATNYTWSPGGATTNTNSVTPPTGSTTYTLTGANGVCTASTTATVNVNATPTLTISGTTALCSGQSTILTGATAGAYSWSTGATTNTISVTPPVGSTTYTLTGSNGACVSTITVTVTVTTTPTISISGTTILCSGQSTVLTGATASNYTWSTGATTNTISVTPPLGSTTYTLTGGNGGCTASATTTVSVTATPTLSISGTTALCSGQSTVLTGATAAGYTWSTGANTNTISITPPIGSTTYTLTGANGACVTTNTVTVNITTTPTISISGTINLCSGQSTVLTGATASNYTWSTGATTNTITVTPPIGSTTYTLNGANGVCTASTTATVSVTATPTLSISGTTALCSGQSTVLTGATAAGYTWSTGATTNTISITPGVGSTTYTLTGANGACTLNTTATVSVTATPTVSISGAAPICSGQSIVLTGGTATNYTWSPGGSSASSVTVTPGTSQTYTLTGANGACVTTAVASVSVTPTPTVTITGATPICNGQSISLNGATATSYTWMPGGSNTSGISVTPGSTTTYTITGANGTCTTNAVATVVVNPLPIIGSASVTPAPCGQSTGCINSVSVSNGTPTYTFSYNGGPGSTSSQYCNQPAGTYVLVVTDANGCTATQNISIPNASGPVAPTVVPSTTVACIGDNVVLTVNPAVGGVTYTWTDITGTYTGTTYTITNIGPAGPYNVSVNATDNSNGCVSTTTNLSITVNPLPVINASASPIIICAGQSTVLNASGATSYTWSSNAGSVTTSTASVTPPSSDTYTVTGSSLGCSATQTVAVTVNPLPVITTSVSPGTICAGQSTVLSAGGATTYTWSTNAGSAQTSTVSVTPPTSTIYTVTGDNLGCISTQTVSVNVTPLPPISILANPPSICVGQSTVLTGSGATTYTWSSNAGGVNTTTVVVSPTVTTTYTLAATQSGCSDSTVITVTIGTPPIITASASQSTICSSQTTTLTGTGATNYTWTPGGATTSTVTVTPAVTTIYTLTATSGGCPSTETVSVNVSPTPTITANASAGNICSGQTATLTASGATNYTWMPVGATAPVITVSPGSTASYTLTGETAGCTSSQVVTVNVTPNPTVTASSSQATICSSQTATLTAGGATSYTWMPGGATTGSISVTPGTSTIYTVTGANGNCTSSQTVSVNVNTTATITANASAGAICSGQTTTLTASGATNYTWMPGSSTTSTVSVSPITTTNYTVTGDSLGCISTQVVTVNVTPNPSVTASSTQATICSNQTATLTAGGATNYTWMPGGSTTGSISVNPSTNTIYTVTGANGNCVSTETISVGVTPQPTVTINASSPSLCSGQTATLTASGATSYTWMPTGATTPTITDTPGSTTTYTVTGDNAGCTSTQNVIVTVNPMPTLSSVGSQTACSGSGVNPINYVSTGTATVTWTNTNAGVGIGVSGSGNIGGYSAPIVLTTQTGVITATPSDAGTGCVGLTQTFSVTVNPTPTISGTPIIDSAKCGASTGGVSGGIIVTGGTPTYNYQWFNGGVLMPGEINPTLSNVGGGSYSVAITDANGCTATGGIASFTIPASTAVAASFTATTYAGQAPLNVTFNNGSIGSTVYNWSLGTGGLTSNAQNPSTVYNTAGTFTVILTSYNGGCLDTAMAVIIIDAATTIVIPNIFSPNGDGVNDEFIITCTGMKTLTCDIFNRWGQLVYTLKGPNQSWDGSLNNGNTASEGTYYYMLNAVGDDGKAYNYEGPLTLVH